MPSDLELCNYVGSILESTRSDKEPRPGDIIQCCGPTKSYLFGHMEQPVEVDWGGQICVRPYTPFVSLMGTSKDTLAFVTSGGYWTSCGEVEMFEYIGKANKLFCIWGNAGWCAGGAVKFKAEVNVWKLFMENIY